MERLLFEILVYNRPLDKFNSYWEKKVSKFRRNETDEEWKDKKVIYKECYHRPTRWKNSVIGYINIYISGIDLITTLSIDARRKKFWKVLQTYLLIHQHLLEHALILICPPQIS